ncbi:MAG: RNA chaperone Hfq [bacterium]|nr:RNA chaperone Hfq [bacterium]
MNERNEDSRPLFDLPPKRQPPPRKAPINIQDSFLFGSLKEARVLAISLVTGKAIKGQIKRFDRYAIVVESDSQEILIYKHAIVAITEVPSDHGPP